MVKPALEQLEMPALETTHCLVRPGVTQAVTQAVTGGQTDWSEGGVTFHLSLKRNDFVMLLRDVT